MQPATEQQAKIILDRFQQRAEDVPKILGALSQIDINRYPDLKPEYYALLRRGQVLIHKNNKVKNDIKESYQFSRGVVGLQGLGEMGFLPLLVWGVIAASTAGTSKFAYDAYELNQKIKEQQRLENEGLTPQQAGAIVSGQSTGIIERLSKNIVIPIAVVAGLMFLGSRLIAKNRRAKNVR